VLCRCAVSGPRTGVPGCASANCAAARPLTVTTALLVAPTLRAQCRTEPSPHRNAAQLLRQEPTSEQSQGHCKYVEIVGLLGNEFKG